MPSRTERHERIRKLTSPTERAASMHHILDWYFTRASDDDVRPEALYDDVRGREPRVQPGECGRRDDVDVPVIEMGDRTLGRKSNRLAKSLSDALGRCFVSDRSDIPVREANVDGTAIRVGDHVEETRHVTESTGRFPLPILPSAP